MTSRLPHGDWDDDLVARAGWPLRRAALVSVGGGLGSLALADLQRVRGRPVGDLVVVARHADPSRTFRRWAENSQLPPTGRLRSDSSSRIDNPWGWPGYAMSESRRRRAPGPVARSVVEPLFGIRYAPAAGDVYRGVLREAARIGWDSMTVRGRAVAVRRRRGGGFFVAVDPPPDDGTGDGTGDGAGATRILQCDAVHLAPGHGAPLVPADAAAALAAHPSWRGRIVQAYQPHEELYGALEPGATVLLRGGGIAAEQVLARLVAVRSRLGGDLTVLHAPHRPDSDLDVAGRLASVRRPYSAPRSAFGGPLHARLSRQSRRGGADALLAEVRRPTTPLRRSLRSELERGRRAGWYRPVLAATVEPREAPPATPGTAGTAGIPVLIEDAPPGVGTGADRVVVAAVIDCTGLAGPRTDTGLLGDVAGWLPDHRFAVDAAFAVAGSRNGPGAVYASGVLAERGPVGPVDSFWGLTYAAYAISRDLARHGIGPTMGPLGSAAAWWRWVADRAP